MDCRRTVRQIARQYERVTAVLSSWGMAAGDQECHC